MEYDETIEEVISNDTENNQESSTETVETPYISRDEDLTTEELVNRVILQLQYNEDQAAARDEALQEKIDQIVCSLSENDIDEVKESVSDELEVNETQPLDLISGNDIRSMARNLSKLVDETVSANTVQEDEILYKPLNEYSTSESLLLFSAVIMFLLAVIIFFKK